MHHVLIKNVRCTYKCSVIVPLHLFRPLNMKLNIAHLHFFCLKLCIDFLLLNNKLQELSGLKQHKIIISQFLWPRHLSWYQFIGCFMRASSLVTNPVFVPIYRWPELLNILDPGISSDWCFMVRNASQISIQLIILKIDKKNNNLHFWAIIFFQILCKHFIYNMPFARWGN